MLHGELVSHNFFQNIPKAMIGMIKLQPII